MIENGLQRKGYDEVSLTSLSTADFSGIEQLTNSLSSMSCGTSDNLTVSLPSLRVDAFTVGLAGQVSGGRRKIGRAHV